MFSRPATPKLRVVYHPGFVGWIAIRISLSLQAFVPFWMAVRSADMFHPESR
jgi:hypothetical protein